MGRRTGRADLPLHGGRVPSWLAARMARLGRVVAEAVVLHYGPDEFLRRLAHPFWFQAFGSVMGMDWHSSGITTSVVGALKRGLEPVASELGVFVCGGRGRHSRKTPGELNAIAERVGIDGDALGRCSRLVAKVDNAAVQDGFDLYLHSFVVTAGGSWAVIQQGMNPALRQARRYHWLSENLESFVDQPHTAIHGHSRGCIFNLTDARARPSRSAQLELVREGPDRAVAAIRDMRPVAVPVQPPLPHLQMPSRHEICGSDVVLKRLHATLAAASDRGPKDFAELLLTPGVGPRTVFALAMASEVIHGTASRFSDPARFSTALGGKDGHPFPVPLRVYDETIRILRQAVDGARLGREDKLSAIARLDEESRRIDRHLTGPSFDDFIENQRRKN
ncbi:MAG: DUF763 domain-containing protein [Deltaproteobacteria bacterium]|nr:DUF763 domain-containing protein [Deltaproteobacteria bacterium]MBW2361351.1 DUF763 domain-containing protein [Deltaproteobacteria bacterium]